MASKSNKVEHQQHIEECVEYILEHKSGWTQFTSWAREKYGINNRHANTMWKDAWDVLNEEFSEEIRKTVNKTLTELEQVKMSAIENDDRRIWLETIKYQNKIKGGEIERQEITHKGEIKLTWGDADSRDDA